MLAESAGVGVGSLQQRVAFQVRIVSRTFRLGDLGWYLLFSRARRAAEAIQDCNIAIALVDREAIILPRGEHTLMETCSRAGILSPWSLAIHPKSICSLIFRVWPKLLGLPPTLLKKFQEVEDVNSPPEGGTALRTTPELPQDILMAIFATFEIPDLKRAGSVCSSWRSAYSELCNRAKYKLSQTPCLFYTSEPAGDNVAFLYSLVEKRAYKLALPEPPIRSRFLIGSSHGWLVTVDDRSEMHLLNPITNDKLLSLQ